MKCYIIVLLRYCSDVCSGATCHKGNEMSSGKNTCHKGNEMPSGKNDYLSPFF